MRIAVAAQSTKARSADTCPSGSEELLNSKQRAADEKRCCRTLITLDPSISFRSKWSHWEEWLASGNILAYESSRFFCRACSKTEL